MRLRRVRDEELAAARVFPVERHADSSTQIWQLVQLIADRVAWATVAVAPGIAVLNHEIGHHTVNRSPIEKSLADEIDEVGDGQRRVRDRELDFNRPAIRF